jgi:formate dehydrogenase (hydrogenase)
MPPRPNFGPDTYGERTICDTWDMIESSADRRRRSRNGDRLTSPRERLTTPLIRIDGELRPTTWDVALDRVASEFGAIKAVHGGTAFALFSCSKSTNEMNYAAQKFARLALDSNNIDSCNRT